MNYLQNLYFYIPELIVIATMILLLFLEASYKNSMERKPAIFIGALIGLGASLYTLCIGFHNTPITIFSNALTIDPFSTLIKVILVVGTMGAIYLGQSSKDIYLDLKSEFVIMSLGLLVGGMLLASANNLLTVYLGVETLSILSYVMASFKKNDELSSEAGLKYVLYGGICAGIMLFGMSHIYGVLGSIQFSEIAIRINQVYGFRLVILLVSFLFFFVGVAYKIAAVPFHMWSPDVYEGSPLPVTTFFAIVPKMAGIAAIVRVTMVFFDHPGTLHISWVGLLSIIGALTMTVGNVSAIGQKSVKRMLAYSSISHAGFMLLGVVVVNELGIRSILFYAVTYLFMTLVAFYITSYVSDTYGNDHFERFNGLVQRYPVMAIMMTITMLSLAGVPPLSGFVAKFNILSVIIQKKFYALAFIAVLNSVVSLYYYMKIVRMMILKSTESTESISGFGYINQSVVVVLSVPVVVLGIFWEQVLLIANMAKIYIQ